MPVTSSTELTNDSFPGATESFYSSWGDEGADAACPPSADEISRRANALLGHLRGTPAIWKAVDPAIVTTDDLDAAIPAVCRVDDVVFRFMVARQYDVDSAARRYLKFCTAAREAGVDSLSRLDALPAAARRVVDGGAWHLPRSTDKRGRPILNVYVKNVDWSMYDVAAMKAACLHYCWLLCTTPGAESPTADESVAGGWKAAFAAQLQGVTLCLYLAGMSSSQVRKDYVKFSNRLAQECLPLRLSAVYVIDAPWMVSRMMWPMVRLFLSAKLRKRIHWVSPRESAPSHGSGDHAGSYPMLHDAIPESAIPESHDGEWSPQPSVTPSSNESNSSDE